MNKYSHHFTGSSIFIKVVFSNRERLMKKRDRGWEREKWKVIIFCKTFFSMEKKKV